jgi:hypothetical protein
MIEVPYPYTQILDSNGKLAETVCLIDHIGGFDENKSNRILQILNQSADCSRVVWHQCLDSSMTSIYPNIAIEFDADLQNQLNLKHFHDYRFHPELTFKKFLCSFNGSAHVSRKLLVSILNRFGWFDPETCSKNFQFSTAKIDGHLADYLDSDRHRYYRRFFIGEQNGNFYDAIYSFGHVQYDHAHNIHNLETKLTSSFLHIVSETMATSYCPFVTEKFLYSVVTRGLFVAYAQPGWHDHLERYYGFRKYARVFDYRFDSIQNPVERLIELMSMLSKFSLLSSDDWRDLYEMESDTIEHNYDWYFSKKYIKYLEQFS